MKMDDRRLPEGAAEKAGVRSLWLCLAFSFFWSLIAHGYAFVADAFSHDSLNALFAGAQETMWKLELGRFLVPGIRIALHGKIALPLLIGVLATAFLALSAWIIIREYRIQSVPAIALICGIMVTNTTVTALAAAYIYELDIDLLALLLSVLAWKCWRNARGHKGFYLAAAVLTAFVLAIYQSYVSVTVCLMMFDCIFRLMNRDSAADTVKTGVGGILTLAVGGVLYLAALWAVSAAFHVQLSQEYNSVSRLWSASEYSIFYRVAKAMYLSLTVFLPRKLGWRGTVSAAVLILTGFAAAAAFVRRRRLPVWNRVLALCLICLLPLGSNLAAVPTNQAHDLMRYASFLALLIPFFLLYGARSGRELGSGVWLRRIAAAAAIVLLWNNCILSNTQNMKKALEQKATLSVMTRVVDDICKTEDFDPASDPVCFIGGVDLQKMPGFERTYNQAGSKGTSLLWPQTAPSFRYYPYQAYLTYVLNTPLLQCDDETYEALRQNADVQAMPVYPKAGSIRFVDGVLVVKMGADRRN